MAEMITESLAWSDSDSRIETETSGAYVAWNDQDAVWRARASDLSELLSVEEDWDGLGARAPSGDVFSLAIEFFNYLIAHGEKWDPPSRIVPSPDGAVIFEWHLPVLYLEAEIADASCIEWMSVEGDMPAEHWTECWRRKPAGREITMEPDYVAVSEIGEQPLSAESMAA